MKLAQLFSVYKNFKMGTEPMREVTGLSFDSRKVQSGDVYFALRGLTHDSHDYLGEVCTKNITGVVVENTAKIPATFNGGILVVPNTKEAMLRLAGRYYGNPAQNLYCVGVTGTNGKTSTAYMIESILNNFGMPTGVMGTINHHIGNKVWESELTTPDAITLQKRLRDFLALGAKAVVFEVSSHAIDQDRVNGIPFNCVVFTNLTRDHLDYHKTMQNYFTAKQKLFTELVSESRNERVSAIINVSDEWGQKIEVSSHARRITYGEVKSDFQFQVIESNFSGTRFHLQTPSGQSDVSIKLPGRHNVYNSVAAIAVGCSAGASLEKCIEGIESFTGVPGRLERVPNKKDLNVFVDYAHSDDALRAVLTILNEIRRVKKTKNRIITVFGCGGDRDKGKRPLMAKVAMAHSDIVFITSDNPRTEDPMTIIQDILSGVDKDLMKVKIFVEVDRKEAIRKAIEEAGPIDVVLIAGKGHEEYQIVGEKKYAFNDVQIAGKILNGL
ncbi:MAG: UDP-N-acetylmuramoyl-L-alanyl-D-glutamate--2,6-diaminopimelate ligase [Bdellovibrionales bacterium RBG_16_40_8]|nr:MAG: UDP-N-acetylmuramoyl-L-alanyl-D-glutamate--2,6-diaminopimelate ligase [Bdellovibrionales bacterium RBG_16_40_8]